MTVNGFSVVFLALFFGLFTLEGINESIVGPIFPHQARTYHNAGYFIVGFAMAMFPVGQIFVSLIFWYLQLEKNLFPVLSVGAFLSASTMLSFGLTDYVHNDLAYKFLSCFSRFLTGCALGVCSCTYYPLTIQLLGTLGTKSVTLVFSFFYVGLSIGPFFGLKLESMVSYKFVFILVFAMEAILIAFLCIFRQFLPKQESNEASKSEKCITSGNPTPKLWIKMMSSPGFYILLGIPLILNANIAYVEGTLADTMKSTWNSSEREVEITYIVAGSVLVPSSLCASALFMKGFAFQVITLCIFQYSSTMIALYIISTTTWIAKYPAIVFIIFFINVPRSAASSLTYAVADMYCTEVFNNYSLRSVRALVAPLFSIANTVGVVVGYLVFVGVFREYIGYTWGLLGLIIIGQSHALLVAGLLLKNKFIFSRHFVKDF